MSDIFARKPRALREAERGLGSLEARLGDLYQTVLNMLGSSTDDPAKVEALGPLLHRLAELVQVVRLSRMELAIDTIESARVQVEEWTREFAHMIELDPNLYPQLQWIVTQAIQMFIKAEGALRPKGRPGEKQEEEAQTREILIQSDVLFQCYQSLFPAERMLAVSGRRKGWQIELGAVFDVTGNASVGHVRADPRKLGQALIAMSCTDTHLAAWFHSHPGTGLLSTCPSGIDIRQHTDWLRDYSSRLLSGIFVQDGHLRFWGSGLEQGGIRVRILGSGVTGVKGEDHVYQLATS